MFRIRMRHAALLFALMVVGCGEATDKFKESRPKTVSASGTVTYKGQPLADATIVFVPSTAGGVAASAMSDSAGKFEMQAFPPDAGVVPGSYTVTVTKMQQPPEQTYSEDSHDAMPTAAPKPTSLIPEKYAGAKTSGLSAVIAETGDENIVLELKD